MDIWKGYLKRNDKVAWRVLEDKCILLHLNSGIYYTLNEAGKFLWESFDGKKQLMEIHGEMMDRYDVERETARSDILEIVEDLMKEDLVSDYDKPPSDPSVL
jgi:hypothetical protein